MTIHAEAALMAFGAFDADVIVSPSPDAPVEVQLAALRENAIQMQRNINNLASSQKKAEALANTRHADTSAAIGRVDEGLSTKLERSALEGLPLAAAGLLVTAGGVLLQAL